MDKGYIPKGMKITGDLETDGDLLLAGEVDGNVSCGGTLELNGAIRGKRLKVGRVELTEGVIQSDIECSDYISIDSGVTIIGNVKARNADVNGAVKGDMDVSENVSVGSTAVLDGALRTKTINVDLGAICNVDLKESYSDHKASDFFEEYLRDRK
ncbi:MAG: polymer-forming cytoskeletal protein [Lachnospiraceae bacterium]|nr:polymer-forming cytoskeletal protein [Lachnospiraceae bacterium]